jgi:hypothetical protein
MGSATTPWRPIAATCRRWRAGCINMAGRGCSRPRRPTCRPTCSPATASPVRPRWAGA